MNLPAAKIARARTGRFGKDRMRVDQVVGSRPTGFGGQFDSLAACRGSAGAGCAISWRAAAIECAAYGRKRFHRVSMYLPPVTKIESFRMPGQSLRIAKKVA
jgi:hypothetical protein